MTLQAVFLACFLLHVGVFVLGDPLSKDFALVFMQNFHRDHGKARLHVTLTAYEPDTDVHIFLPNGMFETHISVSPGSPVKVKLPLDLELQNSTRSKKVVRIRSTGLLSVVATNERPYTSSMWLVQPTSEWGTKYYMFTPGEGPVETYGEIAVVNGYKRNVVRFNVNGVTFYGDHTSSADEPLILDLDPWETVQLQSSQSLSGGRISSEEAIGVFAGHSCAQKGTRCSHVCIQLLPVTTWGSHFVVPRILFQSTTNSIYVLASAEGTVLVRNGDYATERQILPGSVEEFHVHSSTSAYISSSVGLMVLLYGNSDIYKSVYDGFLINLTPEKYFCSSYALASIPSIRHYVFLTAPINSISELQLNGTKLIDLQWGDNAGTDLVYTQLTLIQHAGYTVISHPHGPFGVFAVIIDKINAYGIQGICLDKVKGLHAGPSMDELVPIVTNGSASSAPSHKTCIAWDWSHFRTFNGSHIIQSGNCTVMLLARTDNETNYLPFSVERTIVPEIALRIKAFGLTIKILASETIVVVDGMSHYPPMTLDEGRLNITQHGFLTQASFSFGLRVLVGSRSIHLEIPSISAGLSGLCMGIKLDNSTDNGSNQTHPVHLADELACVLQHYTECDKPLANAASCLLLEELDVFKPCHVVLDPKPFVESCNFEVCNNSSDPCVTVEAYARACGVEGMDLKGWRNLTQCANQCPSHSSYESCTPHQSCLDPDSMCDPSPCYESCVCHQGFQLYMGLCIPANHGVCMWEGRSYTVGSEWLSTDCQTLCQCGGSTGVECHNIDGCNLGYQCAFYEGIWSCLALAKLPCSVYQGSNYIPLYGQISKYKDYCITKMADVCRPVQGMPVFAVTLISGADESTGSNYVKAVDINFSGRLVTLSHVYAGRIEVDGVLLHTPVLLNNDIEIFRGGLGGVIFQARHGLTLLFAGDGRVLAHLPVAYTSAICGLCAAEPNDTNSDLENCGPTCHGNCSTCSSRGSLDSSSCGMLTDDQGPFQECYKQINHAGYVSRCIQDVCSQADLCNVLSSFTAICQEAELVVYPWRTDSFCSPHCPPNSSYNLCTFSCSRTCGEFQPSSCALPCREGCSCDPGYVLSGEQCVLPEDCGCSYDGFYWKTGETFYKKNCRELCECLNGGSISCKNHSCLLEQECVLDGVVWSCSAKMMPACWVTSRLHYHTSDGGLVEVNGNCSYTMAKLCQTSNLTKFEVHIPAGDLETNSKMLNRADIYVYGLHVALSRDSDGIQVDGVNHNLPTTIEDGRIVASKLDSALHLVTAFGLVFVFGPSWASLQLPASYAGSVCGLCSNASGNFAESTALPPCLNDTRVYNQISLGGNLSTESSQHKDKHHCGLILAKEGIFRACHASVPPEEYFNMCVINMAMEDGHEEALRQSIQSYIGACRAARAVVHPWRPIKSQTGPNENPTKASCLHNCTGPQNPIGTPLVSNITGHELPIEINCRNGSLPGCAAKRHLSCFVTQKFNYIPFAGQTFYEYSGSASVTFAQLCPGERDLIHFAVRYVDGLLESRGELWVTVYDLNIVLEHQENINVWVNGMFLAPPAAILPGKVWINQDGGLLTLETNIGLSVVHDGEFLLILLPEEYTGHVCGLCVQTNSSDLSTPVMSESKCNATMSEDPGLCQLLLNEDGPFGICHRIFSPYPFYELCLSQQCQFRDLSLACQSLQDYTALCQSQGVTVQPWRRDYFCPFWCPLGSQYIGCGRPCHTCVGDHCSSRCIEGCSCQEGLVWDGTNCVDAEFCRHGSLNAELEVFKFSQQSEFLNCYHPGMPSRCMQCVVNPSTITTFYHFSGPLGYSGAYDLLRTCNYLSSMWLRVVLRTQPGSTGKLHIFFRKSLITFSSTLNVWVNGKNMWLPVLGPSNSFIMRSEELVSFVLPRVLEITLSSSGVAHVAVSHSFPHELCGACATLTQEYSLENWQAGDLS